MIASLIATIARRERMLSLGRTGSQRTTLSVLPHILMIQLKRFKFDEKTNQIKKLDCHVAFSQILKIQDDSTLRLGTPGSPVYYKIKAAIIHLGKDIHFGHYIALVLHDNLWFKYNDNDVSVGTG